MWKYSLLVRSKDLSLLARSHGPGRNKTTVRISPPGSQPCKVPSAAWELTVHHAVLPYFIGPALGMRYMEEEIRLWFEFGVSHTLGSKMCSLILWSCSVGFHDDGPGMASALR